MKQNELPLRDRIVAHLKNTGEATAAAIAKAVGMADFPSKVTNELNAMRADAVVEADRKGKGPDLTYWLAVAQAPLPQAALPDNIRAGTRAAQIWQALPEHGQRPLLAREIVAAIGVKKEVIAPALTEMVKSKQALRHDDGLEYRYTRPAPVDGDSEGGETDINIATDTAPPESLLLNVIAHIRDAIGDDGRTMLDHLPAEVRARLADAEQRAVLATEMLAERGRTVETLQDMIRTASETLAPHVPGTLDTSDMDLQEIADRVVAGVADLTARLNNQDDELLKQVAVIVDLRNQLGKERAAHHALQESPTLESIAPAGYLVRAPKRKPRTLQAEDKAREAALGAIRAGAPRAEVFALVPVGHARRNAEWRPA